MVRVVHVVGTAVPGTRYRPAAVWPSRPVHVVAGVRSGLFPVAAGGFGFLVAQPPHVDLAEVECAGLVGEPVHGGVGGHAVGQCFDPVGRAGLADDDRWQSVVTVGQNREQVAGGVRVDSHGEKVIDDEWAVFMATRASSSDRCNTPE